MILVSVIIPSFNSEAVISDALESVIRQTYGCIEIIVVDDASHDATVATARRKLSAEFNGAWQIMELSENGGPSAARNKGIKAANGAWVQFLDSDDIMMPTKIALQMEVAAAAASDVASVYSPWRRGFFENGEIIWVDRLSMPDMAGKPPVMCLIGGDRPLLAAGLTRRSVLEQIGGLDENLRFWECEEVSVRIAQAGRLVSAPSVAPVYLWRSYRGETYVGHDQSRYRIVPVAISWIELVIEAAGDRRFDTLGLTLEDQRVLVDDCTYWARLLFYADRAAFSKFMGLVRHFHPDYRPSFPRFVSVLSRYLPYETVEQCVAIARRPVSFGRALLRPRHSRKTAPVLNAD